MTEFHDEFTDLLGAYALDAVDDDERAALDAHVRTCPWCSAEVAEHREVAAFLSQTGGVAPDGVWDRISAEISPPAPPLRLTFSPAGEARPAPVPEPAAVPSNLVPMASRGSMSRRAAAGILAVAALLLAVVGFVAVDQTRTANNLRDTASTATTPQPGDLTVSLTSTDTKAKATAVVDGEGRGYFFSDDLPDIGKDRLFQLWGQVDGVVLSLGTFGSNAKVVKFHLDPNRLDGVQAFAVTEEQRPGVVSSANDPVLIGEVS